MNLVLDVLILSLNPSLTFKKKNYFFLLQGIVGNASTGWKTAMVARNRGSEVYF